MYMQVRLFYDVVKNPARTLTDMKFGSKYFVIQEHWIQFKHVRK